jgi:glycosyltransferase involved in cell wall biosynthesis
MGTQVNKANRVTGLVPNFNQGQFFGDCLQGFMQQKRCPDRLIVVDDASTDDSVELISKALDKHSYMSDTLNISSDDIKSVTLWRIPEIEVHLVQLKKNKGRAGACNIGIGLTIDKTDVYALCDCDDIYLPNKISSSMGILQRHAEVGVVYTDLIQWEVAADKKERHYYRSFDYKTHVGRNVCNGLSLVRAECYKIFGLYDEELRVAEDYDMWMRIGEASVLYHLPEVGYIYRIWGNNETKTIKKDVWQRCLQRIHQKRLGRTNGRGNTA